MGVECPKCKTENTSDSEFCKKCATPLPSSKEIHVTETLETPKEELTTGSSFAGRYQIIEELGKGGMGKVYRVLDKELKEEAALKLIRPEIASDKKTLERFRNELKLARKISHKNVGRMYELMEEKGTRYITMEYVPGEDLKRLIRKVEQFTAGKSIFIAKQVCDGLAEAHRLGVVHRDLKPQNIMVDEEGNARIMDFGIARSVKGKGVTGAGVMVGTPEYMSPEQAEVKEVDQRSDIYSLGVILYELLTGRVPFEGETPLGIAMKHKSEMPKNPRELNPQIPEEFSRVILRCMEKDKGKRYQNVGEVRSELDRIEKGIPTTEREIPKRKPITSREITVTFGAKKLFIPALVVVAFVIAAVIIWQLLSQKEAVPIPTDKPSLAIMYFKNNTGDEGLVHWRTMLSNLLIADLTQSKHIRILSEDKLFNVLSQLDQLDVETYSSDVLKQVAVQGGVNYILQGAYAKAGDEFRINVMLQDAGTGELIGSELVAGKGEEGIFSMVDELTRRIKVKFKLSEEEVTGDIDRNVGAITTSSPEALKYYSEGRKYHSSGDYRKSIQLMERAVSIDSEFALAYRSMAMSYGNLYLLSEQQKYMQKALELTDRLSDIERYRIQGDFYRGSEKTYDKAIEAYTRLLKLYPEDSVGNNNFGIIYSSLEEWDKAIERYEVPIKNRDESTIFYTNIASAYRAKGLYDRAQKVLEDYIHNISDSDMIHRDLALNYLCQGKWDLALEENDKALYLDPADYQNIVQKGYIFLFKGDLDRAEEEYEKLKKAGEPAALAMRIGYLSWTYLSQGRFEKSKSIIGQGIRLARMVGQSIWEALLRRSLAKVHLKSGNPEEALGECEKALNIFIEEENAFSQRRALHIKGLALLMMGSLDEAQKTANELRKLIDKGMNEKEIRHYFHLMGIIEQERENFPKAIEYLEEASSLLPLDNQAPFIDSLALAYYGAGDMEKALDAYERITSLTTGRIGDGDVYAKSFYMLGKIYEQKGWKSKAIEHYEIFLDLWKNADPRIADVEDARKRLAGLKQ